MEIFDGEYLLGKKWNGKEKKYFKNNKLQSDIEYLYGKKWNCIIYAPKNNNIYEIKNGKGSVKEYYDDGNLFFEGGYLDGEKNGNGREYDWKGNLIFEGEYFFNRRWNGKLNKYSTNSKLISEIEYINGRKKN